MLGVDNRFRFLGPLSANSPQALPRREYGSAYQAPARGRVAFHIAVEGFL